MRKKVECTPLGQKSMCPDDCPGLLTTQYTSTNGPEHREVTIKLCQNPESLGIRVPMIQHVGFLPLVTLYQDASPNHSQRAQILERLSEAEPRSIS